MKTRCAPYAPSSYYEVLAEELRTIADSVRKHPHLNRHFAERLEQLAHQMKEDAKLLRFSHQS
jgi:hypothetical protein